MEHNKPSHGPTSPTNTPRREASTSDLFRAPSEESRPLAPVGGEVSGSGAGQEQRHVEAQAKQTKEELKEEGRALADQGREMAEDLAHEVRGAAEGYMSEAARQLDGIARALDAASSELRNQGQAGIAEQVDEVCDGLERLSTRMSSNDLNAVAEDARSWARDNPAGFLGGSVALGFALSRLLKASSAPSGTQEVHEPQHERGHDPGVSFDDKALRPTSGYVQSDPDVEAPTYDPQRS